MNIGTTSHMTLTISGTDGNATYTIHANRESQTLRVTHGTERVEIHQLHGDMLDDYMDDIRDELYNVIVEHHSAHDTRHNWMIDEIYEFLDSVREW